SRTVADNWLKANLDGYVQWLKNNNSLLILTWDEDDYSDNNHIPTIFFGPMVNPGLYDEGASGITHHNVLRTIEDMYGISHSGNAANVSPITDVWLTVTPIQLTSFLASADESDIILNWSTASELNNDFFTIENSINGTSFKKIESVKGAGTTSEHHHYEYIHKNPFIGKSYYRLKQTDFNGKYSYSKIISVQFKPSDEGSVVIYPNPSDGQSIHLQLKNMDADDLQIDLINMLGQRIETQAIKPIGSEETIITLKPTQPLPEGIYIVKVADLPSQKLVVK
ncbi:MAG TPA: hypothetical protein DGG95_08890, partial [Cytophagales bacterium]|nr:hypothetical protein [Cytophagales bacterium]